MAIPRYTSNGFSHSCLIKRAKEYRNSTKSKLSLNQAKNKIAQDINFKNWRAIEKEPRNQTRDIFYHDAFSDRKSYYDEYEQYLKDSGTEQSIQAYRDFVVKKFQQGSFKNKNKNDDSLLQEIIDRLQSFGPDSLLPQNLPDYLFIKVRDSFESLSLENNEESLVPTQIIILLNGAIEAQKNPTWNGKVTLSEEAFIAQIDSYLIHLSLEHFKRSLGLEYTSPTLSDLFNPEHQMEIKASKDFFSRAQEVFGDEIPD